MLKFIAANALGEAPVETIIEHGSKISALWTSTGERL
jgi:hypothetical protein